MHMADALLSPAVGATFWAGSLGLIAYCAKRLKESIHERIVPLMGVLGAFIFAAQMISFTIPGTGSSGHIGGGMILAILLGSLCCAYCNCISVDNSVSVLCRWWAIGAWM